MVNKNSACGYLAEVYYSREVTWQSDGQQVKNWDNFNPHFSGDATNLRKPDIVDHNGINYLCGASEATPINTSGSSFFRNNSTEALTLNDIFRLFTPRYNEKWYANANFFIPLDAIEQPEIYIESYTVNPITKTVKISGTTLGRNLTSDISADKDDVFDWQLTIIAPFGN
ncbi:hypothetical protein [Rheinheimera maricola]|uniref:Uncharacterized protein n=1 Tax=Rheinheimera maricola TaxID=2793282 RepID=A0ABS7XFF0_9GAMM|nr:hypothetical protein [Rheinheimera maricola]MBZ9613378.1 hypothetical protein [Rheinheimera maricola]